MFKKAMMTLQHVNLRREGDEDTAETAVDLKLRGTVLADVQDTLTGDRPLPLWDAHGAPTIPGIVLDLPGEIKDMTLDLGNVRLVGCRARKFKLEPTDDRKLNLTLQVSAHAEPDQVAKLAELLGEDILATLQRTSLDIVEAIEGLRPKEGDGVESVTLSGGGSSVTLRARQKRQGAEA